MDMLRDWLWSGPMKLLLQHVRWFLLSLKVVPLALAKLLLINLPLGNMATLFKFEDRVYPLEVYDLT
ncbi:hypothetical protein Bca52824_014363 [Brassica carinata]|uniref:Uncharacterized protein n=1 Tax=Brassica carinata TaxID=52824 RepID=A0A8X7W2S1_BRACI|nr:hypothetical protein Bca52824_014363 [Brassica carinata]